MYFADGLACFWLKFMWCQMLILFECLFNWIQTVPPSSSYHLVMNLCIHFSWLRMDTVVDLNTVTCSSNDYLRVLLFFANYFFKFLHLKHSSFWEKKGIQLWETTKYWFCFFSLPNKFSELKAVLSLKIENDCITWIYSSLVISYSNDSFLV